MKSILLLGSKGFIGSRLMDYLVSKDYSVQGIDLGWFNNEPDILTRQQDYNTLTKEEIQSFDIVILLAAHSSVSMCFSDKEGCFRNNVTNFINLLNKLNDTQKFVYASSASVYGATGNQKASEAFNTFVPTNIYDVNKWICDICAQISGKNYYGLRFGTVCGNSPVMRLELMLNSMVDNAQINDVINVTNRNNYRPILGITDLVRAVETIIESDKQNTQGIYNLCSFNSTVDIMSNTIMNIINNRRQKYYEDKYSPAGVSFPKVTIKYLADTPSYNMSMSTHKFIETFDFKFTDTIESIAQDILDNQDKVLIRGIRNYIKYEL